MNELKELKRLLKFYEEAKDDDRMSIKEQRSLCKNYAVNHINKITGGSVEEGKIEFDYRNDKITCTYYTSTFSGEQFIEFRFYRDKCCIWDKLKSITLTIE